MLSAAFEPLRLLCQNDATPGYGPGSGMGYGRYGWSHMMSPLGGGLFMVLLLVLVFIPLSRFSGRAGSGPAETALDVLKKRYARGEISKEDFERMKQDIKD
jgi:putative membrane protein